MKTFLYPFISAAAAAGFTQFNLLPAALRFAQSSYDVGGSDAIAAPPRVRLVRVIMTAKTGVARKIVLPVSTPPQ